MTILRAELKFFKPMEVSDAATNGGHRTNVAANEIFSGAMQNVFSNVFSAERNTGSTKNRFVYCCNHNANYETAINMKVWLDKETSGGDYIYFIVATQGMVQSGITGSEEKFTVLNATSDISVGGNTFVGSFPDASLTGSIVAGKKFRITNKADPDAVTGTEEEVTVTGTPVVAGTQVTFTFTPVVGNAYTVSSGTRACKIYNPGDVVADYGTITKSSAAGTFDDITYPPILHNISTVEDTFTFTFSNATQFTCSGARIGAVGSGDITTDFSPNNPTFSLPYFTIEKEMWGGTWAAGNTLTLPTHDSSVVVCERRVVPAGCSPFTSNNTVLAVSVESA